jgi:hypothetical protein
MAGKGILLDKIYDIAGNSKRGKDPNEFSNRIVVAEIWQTSENLKPVWGSRGGIFLARLALSEISRETVST